MNKAILIGHLTKDPDIRYTQSAEPLAIARYTVAINRRFKREGEPDADFINCVSFGKQAELLEKYFKKGSKIALTGRIQVRSFDDPQGQRRWFTEVISDEIEFIESKAAYEARMAAGGGHNYGQSQDGYGAGNPGASQGFSQDRAPAPAQPPTYEPEGFSAITQSIDEDDLPF